MGTSVIQTTQMAHLAVRSEALEAYLSNCEMSSTTELTDDTKLSLACGFIAGWDRSTAAILREGNCRFEKGDC
jgi:hypothetical protein